MQPQIVAGQSPGESNSLRGFSIGGRLYWGRAVYPESERQNRIYRRVCSAEGSFGVGEAPGWLGVEVRLGSGERPLETAAPLPPICIMKATGAKSLPLRSTSQGFGPRGLMGGIA